MKVSNSSVRLGLVIALSFTLFALGCGYNNNSMGNVNPNPPNASHLYVVNVNSQSVSGFNIDPANGSLTSIGPAAPTGSLPAFTAATPDGKFLYVANTDFVSSSVSGYLIDSATGALTPTTPAQFPITDDIIPLGIAVDPASKHVYTANASSISAFAINPQSGKLTELTGSPVFADATEFLGIKISPDGQFLFATDASGNTITAFTFTADGLPVQVGDPVGTGRSPTQVAVDRASKFVYVADQNSDEISAFKITPGTGVLVANGTVSAGTGCGPQEVAIDPSAKFLFVSCVRSADSILRFDISAIDGSLTPVQQVFPTGVDTRPRGIAVDPSGKFLFSALGNSSQISTQSIGNTGTLNLVGQPKDTGTTPIGIAISPAH